MISIRNIQDVFKFEKENSAEELWPEATYYERLQKNARDFGDRPAVSFHLLHNPKSNCETIGWNELLERVTRFANYLRSIGVKEGDSVALLLPSSTETVVALLAAMTVGIAAPINPTLSPEKIASILEETDAKVLITLKSFPKTNLAQIGAYAAASVPAVHTIVEVDLGEHLRGIRKTLLSYVRPKNELEHQAKIVDFKEALASSNGSSLDFKETEGDRVCAYFHTGGTTGAPKIAQHNRYGGMFNGWVLGNMVIDETDVVISPLPLFHVFAVYPILMGALFRGAHLILPTPAGYRGDGVIPNFWKLVAYWKATFIVAVPTAVAALLNQKVNADISSLKSVFCGSAPMPVPTFKKFTEVTGIEILEGYGMTEATCVVSVNPPEGEKKIGSVGLPLPYFDIAILQYDHSGKITKACGIGEVGEICVSSPTIMMGKTYKTIAQNTGLFADKQYLRTGDLGRVDEDGYIWITGRSKDIIIRGGANIDPLIIEEPLVKHPKVRICGAVGQPDPHAGEVPAIYVQLEEMGRNEDPPTEEELADFLANTISDPIGIPKHVQIVPQIPTTAVGKVFKPALRRLAITRVFSAALEEAQVPAIIADILEHKHTGIIVVLQKVHEDCTTQMVEKVLGPYPYKWVWAHELHQE